MATQLRGGGGLPRARTPGSGTLSEEQRLADLHAYRIDPEPEAVHDGLARLAAEVTGARIGLITVLDRNPWVKAHHGDDGEAGSGGYVAGEVPLRTPSGAVIGTLSVLGAAPRKLGPDQTRLLGLVAEQVMCVLEERRRATVEPPRSGPEALTERERRLAEAQRVSGIGSWSYDFGAGRGWWSEQLYHLLGIDPGTEAPDLEGFLALIHPEDRDRVREVGLELAEVDYRIVRPDSSVRVVHAHLWPVRGADGTVRQVHGSLQDVTEQVEAQAQLHDSEQRSRLTFDNAPTAGVLLAPDGQLIRVNRAASRLLRRSERALLTAHLDELAHPEDRTAVGEDLTRSLEVGSVQKTERRFRRPNGSVIEVLLSTSLVRDSGGQPDYLVGQLEDVTERRQAERERDEHAAMLRAIIDNDHSLVYVKDLDGRYLLVNNAYLKAWDVDETMVIGATDDVLDAGTAALWRANDRRALSGIHEFEETADLPDGRHVFESVKVPLRRADGEIYAVCGISLDVTDRRRATEAVEQARDAALAATAAKSAFLATMSHEIRTPMNAVIGMTGLLLDTELDVVQREFVETVRTSGDQLLAVINDILDFSKIEAGDLELEERPFELRECVEGGVALFAGVAHGLDLVTDIDGELPDVVIGDVTRLRQVIANLVGNAIKFTSEGDVLVAVRPAGEPDDGGLRVAVAVTDTGIGIPTDRLHRLFRSFSQVDASTTRVYGGTGLGLAISKALVEAMGGELTVTSEVGVGSTFAFEVTLRQAPDGRIRRASTPLSRLRGTRALIVDDNETNRRILRLQLESVGIVVADTAFPLEAIEMVRDGARFDLAVLDMHMPVMDGEELAERLHDLPGAADLPLMLLSSVGDPAGERRRHFATVLPKPARRATLLDGVAHTYASRVHQDATSPAAAVSATLLVSPVPSGTTNSDADRYEAGALPPQRRAADSGPRPERALRVLLAEDNTVNQKVAQLLLQKLGHEVDTVGNGREAVDASADADYDVILMDVHMPLLDGLDATREIRAAGRAHRPFVIALTASVTTEDRLACDRAGMDAYLSKPVRADHLGALLTDLADRLGPTANAVTTTSKETR